jgi:hypothetical protein
MRSQQSPQFIIMFLLYLPCPFLSNGVYLRSHRHSLPLPLPSCRRLPRPLVISVLSSCPVLQAPTQPRYPPRLFPISENLQIPSHLCPSPKHVAAKAPQPQASDIKYLTAQCRLKDQSSSLPIGNSRLGKFLKRKSKKEGPHNKRANIRMRK